MTTQLRCLPCFDQTNPTKLHFTTRNLHALRRKKRKKKGSSLTSHESLLFAKNSHSRVQLSLPRKRFLKRLLLFLLLPLFSLSLPSLVSNRWSSSTWLPQGLLIGIAREGGREDGNEISTLWNSMGWFMTAISHQWRHAPPCTQVSRILSPIHSRSPFHPSIHIHARTRFSFCPSFFGGGDNKWRKLIAGARYVAASFDRPTAVHDALHRLDRSSCFHACELTKAQDIEEYAFERTFERSWLDFFFLN